MKTRELGSVGRTGASFNSTIIDLINKVNKPALNRILQAYPFYIRVIGIINNKKLEILSKIDLKALPVDFRLIKDSFYVKYSCLYRILY